MQNALTILPYQDPRAIKNPRSVFRLTGGWTGGGAQKGGKSPCVADGYPQRPVIGPRKVFGIGTHPFQILSSFLSLSLSKSFNSISSPHPFPSSRVIITHNGCRHCPPGNQVGPRPVQPLRLRWCRVLQCHPRRCHSS